MEIIIKEATGIITMNGLSVGNCFEFINGDGLSPLLLVHKNEYHYTVYNIKTGDTFVYDKHKNNTEKIIRLKIKSIVCERIK